MREQQWRLLIEDEVTASFGLAADETLARRVGRGESEPTLRLYSYRSHSALVGRFQNVEQEVRLDCCRRYGITVNRRPTGGGAIIMGADQLGVALTVPGRQRHAYGGARQLMERFSCGLLHTLEHLGIAAAFRRKNDLEVEGRKIAGLGIYRDRSGGLLFHASLLVDLDVPLMLQVLRIPLDKIADKDVASVASRTRTLRSILGAAVRFDGVRDQVARGYASAFGVGLEPAGWSCAERAEIAGLERSRYSTQEWIFQRTEVPDRLGVARIKTPGGLLEVRATLAGTLLKAVYLSGDFFAAEAAVADLEGSLRWHSSAPGAIRDTLAKVYQRWLQDLDGLPLEILVGAIQRATTQTQDPGDPGPAPEPYGCFVTPGIQHA